MILGVDKNKKSVEIDLKRLVETRLLLQANSGGGKSWALRRILEQTHGKIQQIVIDVEDEFHTLREKHDYVLAGSTGADFHADVKSAPLLARKLLELRVSCIIGIFELKAHDRIRFVRYFLDALVNAPRELWHPVLIVVDEAHVFCPQQGEAESAGSVIDLMTRGRKRGFCGILATQRISKLHKDAAAEANNKLIGRSALDVDVDMKRAADELGFFGREQQMVLRTLKPGQFFSFGPALSDVVTEIMVGPTSTTHPMAGSNAAPPPPPRETMKKFLAQMADLPKQAEEEEKNVSTLSKKIRELEVQLKTKAPIVNPELNEVMISKTVTLTRQHFIKELVDAWKIIRPKLVTDFTTSLDKSWKALDDALAINRPVDLSSLKKSAIPVAETVPQYRNFTHTITKEKNGYRVGAPDSNGSLTKAERMTLNVLANYPDGRTKTQVALITGYSHGGGAFNNALGSLRTKGLIEGSSDCLRITTEGSIAAGDVKPLPTGVELLRHWQGQVPKAAREILDVLYEVFPNALTKSDIASRTPSQYQPDGGAFNNAMGQLRTLELIGGRREMALSKDLVS